MRTLSRKSFAIGLLVALLVTYTGRAVPVSAFAVGPLADPVYDTEIIAFKDYVEQNLDAPQLDIMFFLIGGLAVAQMGAQDAMLISPYPNEENVKEWIINCGIQLYNSVIGLVPEGDYYMGIPSIGTQGIKGIPRQVIKGLVAQMMGDAVVAVNYPDLDTFLQDNPDKILLPFNADLQLGVNAIFGLGDGLGNWQNSTNIDASFTWRTVTLNSSSQDSYNSIVNTFTNRTPFNSDGRMSTNSWWQSYALNGVMNFDTSLFNTYHNIFVDVANRRYYFYDNSGNRIENANILPMSYVSAYTEGNAVQQYTFTEWANVNQFSSSYSKEDVIRNIYNGLLPYFRLRGATYTNIWISTPALLADDVDFDFYYGTDWAHRIQFEVTSDLNLDDTDMSAYYNQLTSDYLFDLRGLMGDLVNYVYLNPIWDNIYDLVGNLVVPDRVKVSVDLTPITDLLAPPVPVNLNDIAEYTDNTYLDRVKEHARNAGDIFANYVAFWHNCDSDLVYTMFGAAILVLVGAFVGKWGHS